MDDIQIFRQVLAAWIVFDLFIIIRVTRSLMKDGYSLLDIRGMVKSMFIISIK